MRASIRKAITGVGVLAIAGGALAATAGSALAAPAPYYPDSGATFGGIDFFNAAGVQVTSGLISDTPFAAFAVAQDTPAGVTNPKATTYFYTPVNGVQPGGWGGAQVGNSSAYPVAAPADLAGVPNPDASGNTLSVSGYTATHANTDTSTTDGYAGLYAVRIKVTGTGGTTPAGYAAADIVVSGNTWTQVDGSYTLFADATTTTLNATPPSPSVPGTNVTLNATVADSTTATTIPTGTVQFFNGTTQIGTTQNVSGTGTASVSTNALPTGTSSLTAVFTPTSTASFQGSTSAALPYTIANLDASNAALSVNPTTAAAFTAVDLKATITDTTTPATVPTGTVAFFDGTSQIGSAPVTAGVADIPSYAGFAQGTHSVTAQFSPATGSTIAGSTSAAVVFTATAPACPNGEAATLCTDPQTVTATVAAGTITITTPYSPTNPLDLGTLQLNASGTLLSANAQFGNTTNTGSEIFVTDTRAGDPNWTASVQAGNFTSGTNTIDGQYSGLTNVTAEPVAGNALTAANVTVTNNPAGTGTPAIVAGGTQGIGGAKHTFAQTTVGGDGSIGFIGTFTLNAPTSTPAGVYTGIVTFTVG
jgi:hypothetical protein